MFPHLPHTHTPLSLKQYVCSIFHFQSSKISEKRPSMRKWTVNLVAVLSCRTVWAKLADEEKNPDDIRTIICWKKARNGNLSHSFDLIYKFMSTGQTPNCWWRSKAPQLLLNWPCGDIVFSAALFVGCWITNLSTFKRTTPLMSEPLKSTPQILKNY